MPSDTLKEKEKISETLDRVSSVISVGSAALTLSALSGLIFPTMLLPLGVATAGAAVAATLKLVSLKLPKLQKLKRLEVLMEVYKGGRTREWFEGKLPEQPQDKDREQATKELLQFGLIEEVAGYPTHAPQPFRLTERGRTFIEDVLKKIGKGGGIDWERVNEIEFP